jgi:hypothetical protein
VNASAADAAVMTGSRFIAFFDECGDHSLSKIDADFPLFVLSTVIVERAAYVERIVPAITAFKLKYWPHEGINLHSREIRKAIGPFAFLQVPDVRAAFYGDITMLMRDLPYALFITAIRKRPYLARYGGQARNPYDVALNYSFERILHFLEQSGETRLPVIAEARGAQEDASLEAAFYRLMTQGTWYNAAERFRRLQCPISFRRKQDNIAGIQIADLCAHPSARHVLNPAQPNQAFDCVEPHLYRSGNVTGWKAFPNENG